jgi:hypothetical protein
MEVICHMAKIQELLDRLPPEAALMEIAAALSRLLPAVSEEGRLNFIRQIAGSSGDDQVASMVHL